MAPEKKAPTRIILRRKSRSATHNEQVKSAKPAAINNALKPRSESIKKTKGPAAKQHRDKAKRKLQRALIKRVDARDPAEALAEQQQLISSSSLAISAVPKTPTTPTMTTRAMSAAAAAQERREKRYMDDDDDDDFMDDASVDNNDDGDGDDDGEDEDVWCRRQKCWVPDMEHRERPWAGKQPAGVPTLLWNSYRMLDEYIYRRSIPDAKVMEFPLLDVVHDYQEGDESATPPVPPRGFRWNSKRRLVPVEEEGE